MQINKQTELFKSQKKKKRGKINIYDMACPQMSMCIFFFFNYVQNSREKETATARCGLSLNYAEAIFTSLPLSNFTRPALRFVVIIINIFFF